MQIKLDFSKKPILDVDPNKKTERIAVACSEDFKEFFQRFCKLLKTNESELAQRYILEGMKNDLANIFLPQPHLDKSLREILKDYY